MMDCWGGEVEVEKVIVVVGLSEFSGLAAPIFAALRFRFKVAPIFAALRFRFKVAV